MAAVKSSFNRQRKVAYAAQADKSSRNEATLSGPIMGHFEQHQEMAPCRRCTEDGANPKCSKCHGKGSVGLTNADGTPRMVQVIVHDDGKHKAPKAPAVVETSAAVETAVEAASVTTAAAPVRTSATLASNAIQRSRQLRTWKKCAGHEYGGAYRDSLNDPSRAGKSYDPRNCNHCGCPANWDGQESA